jgi:hypothetical protein
MRKKRRKIGKLTRELTRNARSPRARYLLLSYGAAFLAERAARSALTGGWRLVRGEDPPLNPERLEVRWRDAIGWTVVMGVAMGTASLLARRGAAVGWKRIVGRPIPMGAGKA